MEGGGGREGGKELRISDIELLVGAKNGDKTITK